MWGKYGVPIDSIRGKGTAIQPKQQFKFRIRLLSFGGLEESAPHGFDVTQQVVEIQKPTISFPRIDVKTYSGTLKTFNTPQLSGIRLSLRDDLENGVLRAVNSQVTKQYDFVHGRHSVSSGTSKFSIIVESLDGQNDIRAMDAWRLDGCFIESIDYGSNNYVSGDSSIISMNIEFDYINDHYLESDGARDAVSTLFYVMSKATELV